MLWRSQSGPGLLPGRVDPALDLAMLGAINASSIARAGWGRAPALLTSPEQGALPLRLVGQPLPLRLEPSGVPVRSPHQVDLERERVEPSVLPRLRERGVGRRWIVPKRGQHGPMIRQHGPPGAQSEDRLALG